MAEYELTRQEYERLCQRGPVVRIWWAKLLIRLLIALAALVFFALILYFHQWLFAALVLMFVVFVFVMERRYNRVDFHSDCFQAGRVQVEILPEIIWIRSGVNEVRFSYAELAGVLEYPRCFLIHHNSGFQMRIPRDRLAENEISILAGIQNVLPKVGRRMYKQ